MMTKTTTTSNTQQQKFNRRLFQKQMVTIVLAVVAVAGHAQAQSNFLDPYRACTNALDAAIKGDPVAQHTCFVAAYVRANDPIAGGEDMEGISISMSRLLKAVGDRAFAEALKLERPEIIAAVHSFLQGNLSGTPLTEALVRKAPKIKFPVDVTISNEKPNRLLDRFNQAQKPQ
jgi:hypothetical protein